MSLSPPRKRGRPIRLDRDTVVVTAARLLAADGAAGFSLRGLARELGVSTAAIYHHFPTRNDLFFAVLSARADELERPPLPSDPRERLVTIVVYLVDTLHRLPWVVDILITGETFGRAAMWILDEFVRAAHELGADDEKAIYLYGVMWRFVLGELISRRAAEERARAATEGHPPQHWTDTATPEMLADFPNVVRLLPQWPRAVADYDTATATRDMLNGLLPASGAQK
ncbi:putative transcriptional regulator, TetR family [Nocardia nova SH22a]|uniref:Putative transcriptional regulator, TetR family n=1 Tax=Nocardia nova SH22a TaxID=1415166 RepID=W5TK20_9NOCA|nr:TetR/AcrR family transcriptional regulator [Nocardia nova]AHH19710.1 putative transcriptional regulator, TetR family [Nocardia nova SH22a]